MTTFTIREVLHVVTSKLQIGLMSKWIVTKNYKARTDTPIAGTYILLILLFLTLINLFSFKCFKDKHWGFLVNQLVLSQDKKRMN